LPGGIEARPGRDSSRRSARHRGRNNTHEFAACFGAGGWIIETTLACLSSLPSPASGKGNAKTNQRRLNTSYCVAPQLSFTNTILRNCGVRAHVPGNRSRRTSTQGPGCVDPVHGCPGISTTARHRIPNRRAGRHGDAFCVALAWWPNS
jgi:hypothetical protein